MAVAWMQVAGLVFAGASTWFASARWPLRRGLSANALAARLALLLVLSATMLGWIVLVERWRHRSGIITTFTWQESWWWQLAGVVGVLTTTSAMGHALAAGRSARAEQVAIAQEEAELARVELATLRAQLSPRLLTGVLATVRARVMADPVAAERALETLGDVLHYVLRLDRRRSAARREAFGNGVIEGAESDAAVSVGEEWDAVCAFLELERFRLDLTIHLVDEIEDDAWTAKLPPFVIFPLVEAAVRWIESGAVVTNAGQPPEGGITVQALLLDDPNRLELDVVASAPAEPADMREMYSGNAFDVVHRRLQTASRAALLEVDHPDALTLRMRARLPYNPVL